MTPAEYAATLDAIVGRKLGDRGLALGDAFVDRLFPAEINTHQRLAHFIAQTAHETGGYQWLQELGGPSYFSRYDGRADLGNIHPGDGAKYHGRGLIQLTGRNNYMRATVVVGRDLIGDPDLAATPAIAVQTAVMFWNDHGLSALADADDTVAITRRINGGVNGLAERRAYLAKAKSVLGPD